MRIQNPKKVKTSFNTILAQINPTQGIFEVKQDATYPIDSPLQDVKGTTKTYLKGAVVRGDLWMELDPNKAKQRRIVMVQDENGRYLIPANNLTPRTEEEIKSRNEIEVLSSKVEELLDKAKDEAKTITRESADILDKKYGGFTGKQILVGIVGILVITKLMK